MVWEHPQVLLALWILPAVAWLLVRGHRRRVAAARQFADPVMVQRLMPALSGPRPWVKGNLVLLGLALLIVAAARPRFGVFYEDVTRRSVDLFVLLDVSRSMDATDVVPSRLERAKRDIRDLLEKLEGDRVGLIVFAGKAVVRTPLTTDLGFVRAVLDEIDTASAPRGGTRIGEALQKAMESMKRRFDRDQILVLITDGEDHESFPLDAADKAAQRGIKIFTIGLGDPRAGSRIPQQGQGGTPGYLEYEGKEVWSRMDEKLLQDIALRTGGAYVPAKTQAYDLGEFYESHLADLARGEFEEKKRKRHRERFQWFAFFGLALLLTERLIPLYPRAANNLVLREAET